MATNLTNLTNPINLSPAYLTELQSEHRFAVRRVEELRTVYISAQDRLGEARRNLLAARMDLRRLNDLHLKETAERLLAKVRGATE